MSCFPNCCSKLCRAGPLPHLICYSSSSTPSSHPKLNFAIAYKIKSCLLSSFCESWRKRTGSSREAERGGRGLPIIQVSPIVVVVQLPDGDSLQLNVVYATRRELHITSYQYTLETNSYASFVNRRTIFYQARPSKDKLAPLHCSVNPS